MCMCTRSVRESLTCAAACNVYVRISVENYWFKMNLILIDVPVQVHTSMCVLCELVLTVRMLRKQHSSGERRHGKKDRQSSPEPVTYLLTRSFSHASYGISHTPLSLFMCQLHTSNPQSITKFNFINKLIMMSIYTVEAINSSLLDASAT